VFGEAELPAQQAGPFGHGALLKAVCDGEFFEGEFEGGLEALGILAFAFRRADDMRTNIEQRALWVKRLAISAHGVQG
jgi:hypothetical protein